MLGGPPILERSAVALKRRSGRSEHAVETIALAIALARAAEEKNPRPRALAQSGGAPPRSRSSPMWRSGGAPRPRSSPMRRRRPPTSVAAAERLFHCVPRAPRKQTTRSPPSSHHTPTRISAGSDKGSPRGPPEFSLHKITERPRSFWLLLFFADPPACQSTRC